MRILLFGGNGMLGHRLARDLSARHDVFVTFRKNKEDYVKYGIIDCDFSIGLVCVDDISRVKSVIKTIKPDAIINATGFVKQRDTNPEMSVLVNSVFPRFLSGLCADENIRLLQYSTDCVFSGMRGNYNEKDFPDPVDFYGQTKFLGEVISENQVVVRTSMIGWQINDFRGLLSWLASMRGQSVTGYQRAFFTGFSVGAMSRISEYILSSNMQGLYHLASNPISKYELIVRLVEALKWDISITPDKDFFCDRSLNGNKFQTESGISIPTWSEMIIELASEYEGYKKYYE